MENIGNLTVRAPITLKIKLANPRGVSVANESLRAACLNEQLAEAHANIVVDSQDEAGEPAFLADDDGTHTVELSEPASERQVTGMIFASGFQVTARYGDAGWQTAEEIARDAEIEQQYGIVLS